MIVELLNTVAKNPVDIIFGSSLLAFTGISVQHLLTFKSTASRTSRLSGLAYALKSSAVGFITLVAVAILFGAPVTKKHRKLGETLATALWITAIGVYPGGLALYGAGLKWHDASRLWIMRSGLARHKKAVLRTAQLRIMFAVGGAWLGAFFLPLDWTVAWKLYPVPIFFGAFVGAYSAAIASTTLALFFGFA
ncbi:hypothetical protein HK100_005384 [Physocladia obscura]|uniref:Uncharacterized protein n=1 Tax=Physocladia obscura TaxID=109957 RepID=A0AAD5SXE4_9FUNG|nr:hypothetical protein HK100_005384 [Physocladia obscura]